MYCAQISIEIPQFLTHFTFTVIGSPIWITHSHFVEMNHAPKSPERLSSKKKVMMTCLTGGYPKLQLLLGKGELPTCPACQHLVKEHRFCFADMKTHIERMLSHADGSNSTDAEGDAPGRKDQGAEMAATQEQPPTEQKGQTQEEDDPFAYAKSHAPVIQLLNPGDFGKAYPFRCTVCKSKSWPQGKVGNLNYPRAGTVRHFLDKHLSCPTHLNNLAELDAKKPSASAGAVECQGLAMDDPRCSGKLRDYKHEFERWVCMANLDLFGKHVYSKEASGWIIHAQACLKKTAPAPPGARSVCMECMRLGGAVVW